jgi:peptidyl-prolyl cis-trans isomerase C
MFREDGVQRAAMIALALALAPAAAAAQAPAVAPPVQPLKGALYLVEQLVAVGPLPAPVTEKMRPLNSLAEVEDLLKANSIPFAWSKAELNTALLDPRLVQQIESVPAREPFIIPQGDRVYIMVIVGKR